MESENREQKNTRGKFSLKLVLLAIFIFVLIYFYFLLNNLGTHPLISILMLVFIFLIMISLFLRKKKGSLYSRLFPETKSKIKKEVEEKEPEQSQQKIFKPINLDAKTNQPLVLKCFNCKNLVPNFVKKCPFCNKEIKT